MAWVIQFTGLLLISDVEARWVAGGAGQGRHSPQACPTWGPMCIDLQGWPVPSQDGREQPVN